MKRIVAMAVVTAVIFATVGSAQEQTQAKVRFASLNVYVDSGDAMLAAYQFELITLSGKVKIVGIEGGAHEAFARPPYYDPAALAKDRVIVAAYSTSAKLPRGRTRIARIHVQVTGDMAPDYEARLVTAASAGGEKTAATIQVEQGDEK